jgi:diguanylate cyclase (GGDEF)-like protein
MSLLSLALQLAVVGASESAGPVTTIDTVNNRNLPLSGSLFKAPAQPIESWQAFEEIQSQLTVTPQVSLLGGASLFLARVMHTGADTHFVFEAHSTLIDTVDITVFGADQSVQRFETGYARTLRHALHYGQNLELKPDVEYRIAVVLKSPFFASQPAFRFFERDDYLRHVALENFAVTAALGALLCLALYNLFIFLTVREKTLIYYSLYLMCCFFGWGFTFHLPAALFGWHALEWHYVWFFLIPITQALFYLRFLQVANWSPWLARLTWATIGVSALLLPSSFIALPYAHTLATICISIEMSLAMTCGILAWRRGFAAARFFVLAFVALFIPGLFILPANIGLIPELLDNAELMTLLGTVLDGLLLAFALAEQIRTLQHERDLSLSQMKRAMKLANTDALTGLQSRHAFGVALDAIYAPQPPLDRAVFLVDLDGLKHINDLRGHAAGDALLHRFASGLARLAAPNAASFRLGGDEFTVVAARDHEDVVRQHILVLEKELHSVGFPECGASVGVAYSLEHASGSEVLRHADAQMYRAKAERKASKLSSLSPAKL